MLKVTFLDHSGFVVVTPTAILVFDYYRDPSHALEKVLRENPGLPVDFFVSHHHPDHFNPDIFNLAQNLERCFILSTDIYSKVVHDNLPVAWMSPGDTQEQIPGNLTVKAFGSSDSGVCYLVTLPDGRKIFHAGDLNYWHWNKESTMAEVRAAYSKFVHVVNRLREDTPEIDMAFFPVDPRLGQDYADGARIFLENIKVNYFFPMHFWGAYKAACDFDQYTTDNTDSFCLYVPGESVELKGKMAIRK
ncbi:MAG: MBL fold metallo-hydrolase [Muribaculaceae bacterium]|nr:MBL fold metallo-hydrolase [Muribaculaceae bacterium]